MSMLRKIIGAGSVSLVLALLLGTPSPGRADYPVAPDVVVFCEPTLKHALTDVGALWHSETGIHVRVFTAPTWALLGQIAHHARDDVLIGEGDANADAAAKRQLINPDTLQRVWRNQLVVAALDGNAGNAEAGLSSAGKLAAVAGKQPIAIVDPWAAVAGADSQKALQSLGLWQAVSAKSVGVVGTADAAYLLARGQVRLAVIYATDVAANPAFTIAERLSAASYPPVVYWVAVTEHALSPNADRFVAYLHAAQAQQRLRVDGLEIAP
jgi:molybdate transport system substrate-binding protein